MAAVVADVAVHQVKEHCEIVHFEILIADLIGRLMKMLQMGAELLRWGGESCQVLKLEAEIAVGHQPRVVVSETDFRMVDLDPFQIEMVISSICCK